MFGKRALLCVALVLLVGTPTAAASLRPSERALVDLTNQVRQRRGIPKLNVSARLSRIAHHAARRMAREQDLIHSGFFSLKPWGENLGHGGSVRRVFKALMHSREHRRNILNRLFRKTGVGVAKAGGDFWVCQIFLR